MPTRHAVAFAAALLSLTPATAQIIEADLRRHVEVLASDDFEGRKPGTAGEKRTTDYIIGQFRVAGLSPAGTDGGWLQPVEIVTRSAERSKATFRDGKRRLRLGEDDIALLGRSGRVRIRAAPVWFAGYGVGAAEWRADQIGGTDLRGAIVFILHEGPGIADLPDYRSRVRALADAGAAAVIGVVGADRRWGTVAAGYAGGQHRLADDQVAPVEGAITFAAAGRLLAAAGADLRAMLQSDDATRLRPLRLELVGALEVLTRIDRTASNNVVGKIAGTGAGRESVLLLSHWDHLGVCAPKAADRICNGAVDNASGVATLIEAGRALAAAPPQSREVMLLATTAEEMGLLGAEAFVRAPGAPLASIVAAINVDSAAIAPRGEPVAIIGRGTTPIDDVADSTARELGRAVDQDLEANVMIQRQDGWALTRRGVPTVMVGGSFSDMEKLKAFLGGVYHRPGDDLSRPIELGGAAEDADLLVAITRKLADPALYRSPER